MRRLARLGRASARVALMLAAGLLTLIIPGPHTDEPPPARRLYVLVFAALLLLLLATLGVAQVNLGGLNTAVALLIAGLKAGLVTYYFMHLRTSSRLTWVFVGAGVLWLTILLGLTMADYLTRQAPPMGRIYP